MTYHFHSLLLLGLLYHYGNSPCGKAYQTYYYYLRHTITSFQHRLNLVFIYCVKYYMSCSYQSHPYRYWHLASPPRVCVYDYTIPSYLIHFKIPAKQKMQLHYLIIFSITAWYLIIIFRSITIILP